ncbi:MAG: hypothetical protein JXB32_23540 [Deltaproteobacteria bacterium]|nr:hypothetical protein [Deltaproteobacteria bacterium]
MSRSRIRVCGSVVLALWAIVVLSCAEREVEAGEEPLALAAPSETETLHFEDVRSVEV